MDLSPFWILDSLVDPAAGTVARHGRVLRLRPRSMELLVLLALGAGRVVTRDEAKRRLWDQEFVEESAISQCIYEIRDVLGAAAKQRRVIVTVPKRGYMLGVTPRVDPASGANSLIEPEGNGNGTGGETSPRKPRIALQLPANLRSDGTTPLLGDLAGLLRQSTELDSVTLAESAPGVSFSSDTVDISVQTALSDSPADAIGLSLSVRDTRTTSALGRVQIIGPAGASSALAKAAAAACLEIFGSWTPDRPDS